MYMCDVPYGLVGTKNWFAQETKSHQKGNDISGYYSIMWLKIATTKKKEKDFQSFHFILFNPMPPSGH